MTADPTPDDAPLLPEHLIELLAATIRRDAGPFDRGQEYVAAVHVLDALSESVFPALAGDATAMIGIVMGQLREAREHSEKLAAALTQAVAAFESPKGDQLEVAGRADRDDVDSWHNLLAEVPR